MKCILHIGMEKTGTSSIQSFLESRREEFSRQGIKVLKRFGETFHRELTSCCMNPDRFDDLHSLYGISSKKQRSDFDNNIRMRLGDELSSYSADTVSTIISSEHFSSRLNAPQDIKKLKELLDPWFDDYIVVVYIRPQVDHVSSLYSTALRFKETRKFNNFVKSQLLEKRRTEYYDYLAICNKWAAIFGEGALMVRSYDKACSLSYGLIGDFMSLLPIELEIGRDAPRANSSLSALGQELLRIINVLDLHDSEIPAERIAKVKKNIIAGFRGNGYRIGPEERAQLESGFVERNRQLSEQWCPGFTEVNNNSRSVKVIGEFPEVSAAEKEQVLSVMEILIGSDLRI